MLSVGGTGWLAPAAERFRGGMGRCSGGGGCTRMELAGGVPTGEMFPRAKSQVNGSTGIEPEKNRCNLGGCIAACVEGFRNHVRVWGQLIALRLVFEAKARANHKSPVCGGGLKPSVGPAPLPSPPNRQSGGRWRGVQWPGAGRRRPRRRTGGLPPSSQAHSGSRGFRHHHPLFSNHESTLLWTRFHG